MFPNDFTDLMKLAKSTKEKPELVKDIYKYSHQIHIRTSENLNALDIACLNVNKYSTFETIHEILKFANPNALDKEGQTTLHKVCKENMIINSKDQLKIIKILAPITNVNYMDNYGYTPLMYLYFGGDYGGTNYCSCCECEMCYFIADEYKFPKEKCINEKHNLMFCYESMYGDIKSIKTLILLSNLNNNISNINIVLRICNFCRNNKLLKKYIEKYNFAQDNEEYREYKTLISKYLYTLWYDTIYVYDKVKPSF